MVDHDLRVIGRNSLRVVDGSVFGLSPGTNPQATVMMLGRYVYVFLRLEAWFSVCISLIITERLTIGVVQPWQGLQIRERSKRAERREYNSSLYLFLIQFFLTSLPSLPFCLIVSPRASSGFSQYGCFLGSASLSVKTVCPRPSYWFTNPPFSTARCHRFWTLRRVSLGVVLSTTCNVYLLL